MSENKEVVTPSTSEPIELDRIVNDTVGLSGDLRDLPDAIVPDQPLEEALVQHNHLGDGLGFTPAAPSKPKTLMRTFDYKSAFYDITARVAPNNTIDFIFKNTCFDFKILAANAEDPMTLVSATIHSFVKNWYAKFEKANPTKRSLLEGVEDKSDEAYARGIRALPYTFSINLKPLIMVEKIKESQPNNGEFTTNIHALVQLNLNPPSSTEDASVDVIRSLRINEEINPVFFDACLYVFKESYLRQFNTASDPKGRTEISIAEIRDEYLGGNQNRVEHSTVKSYLGQPTPQVERKANGVSQSVELRKNGAGASGDAEGPSHRTNPPYSPRERGERRAADALIQEVQRQLRQSMQVSYERHQEVTGQMRTLQSQQALIFEQQAQILEDNKTLFQLMNLLAKALGVTK